MTKLCRLASLAAPILFFLSPAAPAQDVAAQGARAQDAQVQDTQGQDPQAQNAHTGISQIRHVIYIIKENRSFDSFYGTFPGANGASTAVYLLRTNHHARPSG